MAPVGAPIVILEVEGEGNEAQHKPKSTVRPRLRSKRSPTTAATRTETRRKETSTVARRNPPPHRRSTLKPFEAATSPMIARKPGDAPLASPAVRHRAQELGIHLQYVPGSGPAGRITHTDLDSLRRQGRTARRARRAAATHSAKAKKKSKSSACAARSRKRCRTPNAASRTSPTSRKST